MREGRAEEIRDDIALNNAVKMKTLFELTERMNTFYILSLVVSDVMLVNGRRVMMTEGRLGSERAIR